MINFLYVTVSCYLFTYEAELINDEGDMTNIEPAAYKLLCHFYIRLKVMWIASISALSFNLMIVCSVIRQICVSDQWNKKDSVQGKWFFFFSLVFRRKKKSKWLNEALICRVVCQEDEKATICPITPTLALNQTVSGDVGWDERLWEMGMANVAICPAILPPSICLLLLHLLFCYHTQTHINTLSLCVSLSLCNL